MVKQGSEDRSGGRGYGTGLGARRPLASLGGGWGTLTLVPQVGVGHELVNHQVHLPQLPRAEVLPASFVLQEDCGWEETGMCSSPCSCSCCAPLLTPKTALPLSSDHLYLHDK